MSIVDKPERPAETAHGIAVRVGWEWIEKWNGPDLGMSVRDLLFNALNDLSIRLEPEWRRLAEEAQAASEHFRDELAETKAREDRLKGELAAERESHRKASSDAHHWEEVATNLREENASIKGVLAEVIAHRDRLLDDAAEDASELAEARAKIGRQQSVLALASAVQGPPEGGWFILSTSTTTRAAPPTEKAQPTDADKRWCSIPSICPRGGFHEAPWGICALRAKPAEQTQEEGVPAVWPTIHGLEQHYREVRGQVAELGKRVDALTVDSDLGGAREAKLADWHRELKGRVDTLGHEAQEDAKAWADMALTLMNRVTKLETKPAPPPPEAAAECKHDLASIAAEAHGAGQQQALADVGEWLAEEGAEDLVRRLDNGEWHAIRGRRQSQDYEIARPIIAPPEAAGPGHAFVGSILNRAICVGLLGCTKAKDDPIHAVPPITGRGK